MSIPERPFDGDVIRKREFSGLRLIDGIYSARTRIPSHSHQQAVFCMALKGACRETFAGQIREYGALTVEFLPPHQCHSLHFPFTDTRAFSIDVPPEWLTQAREYSLRLDDSVHAHGGPLTGLMMKAYDEFRHFDGASPMAIQGLALELLAAVSRNQSKPTTRRSERWLARAVEFLHESFTEPLSIRQIAAVVGVHPVYLAREFRRVHGCTIGEYIRRLRIERACRKLSWSDESLATIAAGAGFSDQSHFSRTFKRLMRVTPAQYRANLDSPR